MYIVHVLLRMSISKTCIFNIIQFLSFYLYHTNLIGIYYIIIFIINYRYLCVLKVTQCTFFNFLIFIIKYFHVLFIPRRTLIVCVNTSRMSIYYSCIHYYRLIYLYYGIKLSISIFTFKDNKNNLYLIKLKNYMIYILCSKTGFIDFRLPFDLEVKNIFFVFSI